MTKNKLILLLFGSILITLFFYNYSSETNTVDFSTEIKPILNKNCISCHGGVAKNGGFSLLFENEALANTSAGSPAIIPGNSMGSEFIKRLHSNNTEVRMPYKKAKLSEEDIELLTRWVDQGAKWGDHWAYSLPDNIKIPEDDNQLKDVSKEFIQNDIDRFVLDKIQNNGLRPNLPAANNIISRRVAFDLVGLPLTAQQLEKYKNFPYETLVDSLLEMPTFGEKWATWWLDMARYADSKGYEKDAGRSMWEYRDWVIKALNKDMPYDQFTIEQLAGDLLPDPSMDQLIATGFHRNTMNNDEGGTDDEEFRVASVMDRVNTTFEVWQSTTIGCVQCHSHPYDPFKHEEYYQAMAFFNNSGDEDTPDENPTLKFYKPVEQIEVDKVLDWISNFGEPSTKNTYQKFLHYREPIYKAHSLRGYTNGVYDNHASSWLWDNGSCYLDNVYTSAANFIFINYSSAYNGTKVIIKENDINGQVLASFVVDKSGKKTIKFPFKKVDKKINLYFETHNDNVKKETTIFQVYWLTFLEDIPGEQEDNYKNITNTFDKLINTKTRTLPVMSENPDYMKRTTQVFDRGNWLMKTDTVQAITPSILNKWNSDWPRNRLGFSKWLVNKENPLTARTLVNRIWHQIYGQGLVSTVEDIGSQSDAPSHPELLDWLALRFMNEHNWSIKALIKEIVMSGTYRQNSETTPENYQLDPDNVLYTRGPRQRLSAEQIRDQALQVAGLLSKKMYGPSVMPPQPDGVWQTVYSGERWIESTGEDKYRRAVYTYLKRTSPYPSFMTFDSGSREVCTIRRTVTNTPLQALITLNDPVYIEAAYYLAKEMQKGGTIDTNITIGYQKATQSIIKEEILVVLKDLYNTTLAEFKNDEEAVKSILTFEKETTNNAELAALTVVANAIMNLDEF